MPIKKPAQKKPPKPKKEAKPKTDPAIAKMLKGHKGRFSKTSGERSGYESRVRANLESRGIPFEYESIKLPYIKSCCPGCGLASKGDYIPDFIIERRSRPRLVVEGKGRFTPQDRTKMIQVKQGNPHEDIRILFQRDDKLNPKSKTRNTGWAAKHGFPCAVGEQVPEEWL